MFSNSEVNIEVKNNMIEIPKDLGMVEIIFYGENKEIKYAKIVDNSDTHFELQFWDNDSPKFVTVHYFDIDFCNRNKEFLSLPGTPLSDTILKKFSQQPDPYMYYVEQWNKEEPKLARQDFNLILTKKQE